MWFIFLLLLVLSPGASLSSYLSVVFDVPVHSALSLSTYLHWTYVELQKKSIHTAMIVASLPFGIYNPMKYYVNLYILFDSFATLWAWLEVSYGLLLWTCICWPVWGVGLRFSRGTVCFASPVLMTVVMCWNVTLISRILANLAGFSWKSLHNNNHYVLYILKRFLYCWCLCQYGALWGCTCTCTIHNLDEKFSLLLCVIVKFCHDFCSSVRLCSTRRCLLTHHTGKSTDWASGQSATASTSLWGELLCRVYWELHETLADELLQWSSFISRCQFRREVACGLLHVWSTCICMLYIN